MTKKPALTHHQIEQLMTEAGRRGDEALVHQCWLALRGDKKAQAVCTRAIADAEEKAKVKRREP